MTHLPCVLAHVVPGRHLDGCPIEACDGCVSAVATDGVLVCGWHEQRARDQLSGAHTPGRHTPSLADLYVALGDPRHGRRPPGPGSDGPPLVIADQRRQARSVIRAVLVTWCMILRDDRGVGLPDERVIAATTRRLTLGAEAGQIAARGEAARLDRALRRRPRPDEPPIDRDATVRRISGLRQRAETLAAQAEQLRDDRATDRDVITALAEHITRHLTWLLDQPEHAEQLVHDLDVAHAGARRLIDAGTRRPGITAPCPDCGQRVHLDAVHLPVPCDVALCRDLDHMADIRCPICGSSGDLRWWRGQATGDLVGDGPVTAGTLLPWLASEHRVTLTPEALRQWARRGHITTLGYAPSGRATYDPIEVASAAIARRSG